MVLSSWRHLNVLRPDFETFVVVLPDDGRIQVKKLLRELSTGAGEQAFGFDRGILVRAIIIARAFALAIIPMRDGVNGFVLSRPSFEIGPRVGGNVFKRHERFVAVLANEAGLADVAREQWQHRRAATGRFGIRGGRSGDAFVPDLLVMADLRSEPIRAQQRMRLSPHLAFELAERLRQPTRQRKIVEVPERKAVLAPEQVERVVGLNCHVAAECGGAGVLSSER